MKKKILVTLAVVACALLLVAGSIVGTLAYLTSTKSVTNTFTVGKVAITLDETEVNTDGTAKNNPATRAENGNKYHLLPGQTYTKDPIVHVLEESEECWVFVKVVNGLSAIETTETGKTIAEQIVANGWTKYTTNDDGSVVYYQAAINAKNEQKNLKVFEKVTIAANVNNTTLATYANAEVVVTAYAVQSAGVDTVDAAWNAVKDLTT